MRWKQHERKCEVCGKTYLFFPNLLETPANIPDLVVFGDHPSRCPDCVDAPDNSPSAEDEIKADLDAKKQEVVEKAEKEDFPREDFPEASPSVGEESSHSDGEYPPTDEGEL